MQIIKSRGTEIFADKLRREYNGEDVVIGIGGGSVIDRAKIIAQPNSCIAVPTTASGASMTSHAVVWGEEKKSIKIRIPIYRKYKGEINLSEDVLNATKLDAFSQAIESYWSIKSTIESRAYCQLAIDILNNSERIEDIIHAGNLTGKAIEIAGTNIIHSLSYPLTINYGVPHGLACGVFLHPTMSYFGWNRFNIKKMEVPRIKFNKDLVIEQAIKYNKIDQIIGGANKEDLENICKFI